MDSSDKSYVEIFNTTDESEYLVLKALLESEGIKIRDMSQRVPQLPVNIDGMGLIRVFIPKEDEEKAKKIIQIYYEAESDNMWKCPKH